MTDNPKAFPRESYGCNNQPGMTLRDYFAAAAIPALFAKLEGQGTPVEVFKYIASHSYQLADAMIAERSKRDA